MATAITVNAMNKGALKTFDDFAEFYASTGVNMDDIANYGDGFTLLPDKRDLVNKAFVIVDFRFAPGKYDDDFVIVELVTKHDEKFVITDGSSGIAKQLAQIKATRVSEKRDDGAPIFCGNGLSVSDYFRNEKTGDTSTKDPGGKDWVPARTFYLAN